MNPTILGVIGPGFLNQVPTLDPLTPRPTVDPLSPSRVLLEVSGPALLAGAGSGFVAASEVTLNPKLQES